MSKESKIANIVIYNGATGSLLDNVTRNGSYKLTQGIKRDCISIESILKKIQFSNRFNNTNTQVYLCGAPRILNTPLTDILINSRLKKIASDYANVTYVPPIPRKFLYKHPEYGISPDANYDEEEYITFLSEIINSINKNYLIKKSMIEVDRKFFDISSKYEEDQTIILKDFIIKHTINTKIIELKNQGIDINKFLSDLRKYLLERQPHDFYYIGDDKIKEYTKYKK